MADANNYRNQAGRPPRGGEGLRPRDTRSEKRLREFLSKKNDGPVGRWADEFNPDDIHLSRSAPRPRNRKSRQPPPRGRAEVPPPQDFRARQETPPTDEPLYDMAGCTASFPLTERFCQNVDCGGFVPLLRQTYESVKEIDTRLERQLPFSSFQHHCTVYLNAVLMDRIKEQGGRPLGDAEFAQDALTTEGTEYIVPEAVQEYVKNIGKFVTPTGEDVYLNVPDIAIPHISDDNHEAGFFGPCDDATHNVYECYVSPAVTARCVPATRDNEADWQPLPPDLAPEDGIPTRNLLGYDTLQDLTAEGRSRLHGIFFPDGNTVEARLRYSHELAARVNTYFRSINDKFKTSSIPRRTPTRTGIVNTVFVETQNDYRKGQDSPPLSLASVNLFSYIPFAAQTANHAYICVYHRRRERRARGLCYVRQNGTALPGWNATINANFNMVGAFGPTTFADFPASFSNAQQRRKLIQLSKFSDCTRFSTTCVLHQRPGTSPRRRFLIRSWTIVPMYSCGMTPCGCLSNDRTLDPTKSRRDRLKPSTSSSEHDGSRCRETDSNRRS
ncbi:Hypothetical protein NTJ_14854 [Nesidiocoris tenuis]|uniref:Uncharacterized protein n=1 Tax=Nesidiocoris tenuis TaxID=355587 RepID=A0ABN7BDV3_9HEMI|nr:Hypothetical protein NTJ_14854 [Nesidiocoris tenuis]